jgi:hypothetical protein
MADRNLVDGYRMKRKRKDRQEECLERLHDTRRRRRAREDEERREQEQV